MAARRAPRTAVAGARLPGLRAAPQAYLRTGGGWGLQGLGTARQTKAKSAPGDRENRRCCCHCKWFKLLLSGCGPSRTQKSLQHLSARCSSGPLLADRTAASGAGAGTPRGGARGPLEQYGLTFWVRRKTGMPMAVSVAMHQAQLRRAAAHSLRTQPSKVSSMNENVQAHMHLCMHRAAY